MTTMRYGTLYQATKNLTRTQLAKLIRADIKNAVACGILPRARYSVTCRSFAGGGAIDVSISFVEKEGFRLANPMRLAWDASHPHRPLCDAPAEVLSLYSEEALAMKAFVEAIVAAYNYDGSDPMTDYYNVRFYGSVDFAYDWSRAKKDAEREEFVTEPANDFGNAPTLPAPAASQSSWLASLGVEV